jgi:hypothetical protein
MRLDTVVVTNIETDVVNRCVHTVALCARVLRSTLRKPEIQVREGVIMMWQRAATSDLVQVFVMNVSIFANKDMTSVIIDYHAQAQYRV